MIKKTTPVFFAVMLTTSASAQAPLDKHRPLSWDYRMVITQTCIRTPYQIPPAMGFDPETKALKAPGETLTATTTGLLRFAPDGTLTVEDGVQTEASFTQIATGQTPVTPPTDFRCNGSYVLSERKMALTVSCDVQTGNPNITVTVGPQNFEGYASLDGQAINLTNLAGDIQTITVAVNDTPVQERQRICTQHLLALR